MGVDGIRRSRGRWAAATPLEAVVDYYVVLGVPRTASGTRIRDAFRRLAKQSHPDVSGEGATDRFRRILEAYEVLSDPVRRAAHDRELERRSRSREPTGLPLDAFWRDLGLGGGARRRRRVDLRLILTPTEAWEGGRLPLEVPLTRTCPVCLGRARLGLLGCPACGLRGTLEEHRTIEVPIAPATRPGSVIEVALPEGVLRLHIHVEP